MLLVFCLCKWQMRLFCTLECAADYKFSELQRTLIFRCPGKSTSKHPKWGCSRACLCGALSRAKPIIAKESKEEG